MSAIVPQDALDEALEQVPLALPEDAGGFGWIMDKELIRRLQEFGPLRDGVHDMAAHAIADLAEVIMDRPVRGGKSPRILLLAGPGGNGADGLRAGRVLAERGRKVDVMVFLSDRGYVQDYPAGSENQQLLAELLSAGGTVITGAHVIEEALSQSHGLILEALVGSGFHSRV